MAILNQIGKGISSFFTAPWRRREAEEQYKRGLARLNELAVREAERKQRLQAQADEPATPRQIEAVRTILPNIGEDPRLSPKEPLAGLSEPEDIFAPRFLTNVPGNYPEGVPLRELQTQVAQEKELDFPQRGEDERQRREATLTRMAETSPDFKRVIEQQGGPNALSYDAENSDILIKHGVTAGLIQDEPGEEGGLTDEQLRAQKLLPNLIGGQRIEKIPDFKGGPEFDQAPQFDRLQPGEDVPEGYQFFSRPSSTVNVYTGKGPTKTMLTTIQKDIYDSAGSINDMNLLASQTEESFLQLEPQVAAWAVQGVQRSKVANWAANRFFKGSFDKGKEWLSRYTTWKTDAKIKVFRWRKEITGVAGGEKEMEKIEEVFPNLSDSHTTFLAKIDAVKIVHASHMARAAYFLDPENGFTKYLDESSTKEDVNALFRLRDWKEFIPESMREAADRNQILFPGVAPEENEQQRRIDEIVRKAREGL